MPNAKSEDSASSIGIAIFATLYFLLALMTLNLVSHDQGHTIAWPAGGVAAAAMLILPGSKRIDAVLALSLASLAAHVISGLTFNVSAWFAIVAAIEMFLIGKFTVPLRPSELTSSRKVIVFVGAALLASIISAVMLAVAMEYRASILVASFATSALGMLVVSPIVVGVWAWWKEVRISAAVSARVQALLLCAMLALTTLTFSQSTYPLLFLPVAAAAGIAFFGGVSGALSSALVIALVGSTMTALGIGPIATVPGGMHARSIFLHTYLLVSFLATLPTAYLLSEIRGRKQELRRRIELLSMAERIALVGHWRFEIGGETVFWSDQVFRIHGLQPSSVPVPIEKAVSFYHPDDRQTVADALERATTRGESFDFAARIIHMNGEVRHVESRGTVEIVNGSPTAVFGVFLDVTEHTHTIWNLERAKRRAIEQAKEAKHLAEVDQLTGVANRRKFLAKFANELARAESGKGTFALIVFDVDHFKAVNDTYGHPFGDSLLRKITTAADSAIRSRDFFGRLGGGEFGVLVPAASMDETLVIADRIRAKVEAIPIDEFSHVSISLGVAEYQPGADCEWIMQAADQSLHEARTRDRNSCVSVT